MHKKILYKFFHSRAADEDAERKEFILNVLLFGSMALFSVATLASFIVSVIRPGSFKHNSISPFVLLGTFTFFAILFVLSRKGFSNGSAHILVFVFFLFAFIMGYHWGIDVNASLLIYSLVIVMAGILVGTRFAFLITGLVVLALVSLGYLQGAGAIMIDRYWRTEPWQTSDTVMTVIIFAVIALVSWLSNREIERSLARAHRSEASLRAERDKLEITVEERTRELREAQLEKISQLYGMAEFGRLSSGLFHDLMNPLLAVSLSVEKAKSEREEKGGGLSRAEHYLEQAFTAAKRMEKFIGAVRKHIGKKSEEKQFSLREETAEVIDMLSYKAHLANVSIVLSGDATAEISGEPVKWSQVMLNLLSNAIDAYDDLRNEGSERVVDITFAKDEDSISCVVLDHGIGIPEENIEKIFEPFFTTKAGRETKGTGIGLSLVKRMVEKDFHGKIAVRSAPHVGTAFSIVLPR